MAPSTVPVPRARKPMTVKPAIPLPHLKRQAAAAAARQRPTTPASETRGSDAAKSDHGSSSPATPAMTATQHNVDSSGPHKDSSRPSTASTDGRAGAGNANEGPSTSDVEQPSNVSVVTTPEENKAQPLINGHGRQESSPAFNGQLDESKPQPPSTIVNENSHSQTPASDESTIPAPRPALAQAEGPQGSQFVADGPVFAHKPHASVQFGVFGESADPSPAPLSAGIAPPPGMPLHAGRPPFVPRASGALPHGGPPPPGLPMLPTNEMDAFGGSRVPYPPAEPYHPGGAFPPTPHSYHDSQPSSIHEEVAPYARLAHAAPRQPPGFGAEAQGRGPTFPGTQSGPAPMMHRQDESRGLAHHIARQFGDPTFSDCTVELVPRFGQQMNPLKIHGHRLVLSRSSVLYELMQKQNPQSFPQSLVLYTDDSWIIPDTFYMAVQQLYGHPLLEATPPPAEGYASAGSSIQQFNFALSYAAAGDLLKWGPVVYRGCEIGARLVNADTFEKAFEFALANYEDKGSYENYKFFEGSRVLLDSIVNFMLRQMPRDFILDNTIANTPGFTRLPYDTPSPSKRADNAPSSPVVVKGHQGKGSRSQSHQIQFGDLSIANGQDDAAQATPKVGQQATAALNAALSRLLINLPFNYLKMFLEAVPARHNAWASGETRYRVVQSVVEEREARRLRALDAVVAGRVPDSIPIQAVLRSLEPSQSAPWSVLGWKEEIVFPNSASGPTLNRQWTPIRDERRTSVAAYP